MRELENAAPFLIIPLVAFTLYIQPLGTAMMVIGLGAVLYALTKSKLAFLAVLLISPLSGMFHHGRLTMEGFQARDPVSVQARLESVKTPAPLNPKNELPADYNIVNSSAQKLQVVTGVLESPSILDNTPLLGMQHLGKEGVPGASIPASAKARVLIYPPSEDSVPAKHSEAMDPKNNPYLHTGQDRLAEEVSLAEKGTHLYAEDSGSLSGVAMGAGPAF
jgi:hypothetical protein